MATLNPKKLKQRKIKQIKKFFIMTGVELLVSPLIVSVLHQILQMTANGKFDLSSLDYSYVSSLKLLLSTDQVQMLFLGVQLAYIAFYVFTEMTVVPSIAKVDTQFITDEIEIPVPAGNGQYGNERFLTEEEKENLYDMFEFTGIEDLETKGGIVVHFKTVKRLFGKAKEVIYYIGKEFHCLIIGASGSGKTRRILLETLWLQIISGVSVVISDVKGEIYHFTNKFAESKGFKTIALDLRNPKKSAHYNFMQPILDALVEGDRAKAIDYTWDLVSVLVGKQKGEPLWYNGETATIAATILIVAIEAPEKFRNLTNVYYFVANMCKPGEFGEIPLNQYLEELEDTHPAKGVFAMAGIAPHKTRSSFFTSALGTLRLFTNPNIAEMTSKSDFNLKDISREKTIFYMIIPDEKKTMYPLVSVLITQMYALQVELANENGLRVPNDTDFDLDEVGNFPYIPVLGNMLSAGRSRGIRCYLVIQDYQQLEQNYKEEFKNIKTNCQVKLYLKSDDDGTLKSISETLGKYTVEVSSASTSVSEGKRNNANFSSSANLAGRSLLEIPEVGKIDSPYALCMIQGKKAGINNLPDLSEYKLNQLYGLGDEKFNTALMIEREKERKEHEIPELQLWGIWNQYQVINQEQEPNPMERVTFLN